MTTESVPRTNAVPAQATIAEGTWHVDGPASAVRFQVRDMWGLRTVRGSFSQLDGTLLVQPAGIAGELTIEAASIDTGNSVRDKHLRSADFFDADGHPKIVFTTSEVTVDGHRLMITGNLLIGGKTMLLQVPMNVSRRNDHLILNTTIFVDRDSVGLGWNLLGMIRGDAELALVVQLTREL